jgi:hypothetical protein
MAAAEILKNGLWLAM